MAKNKGRSSVQDDEVIDEGKVTYEEETGAGKAAAPAESQSFVEKYRNLLLIGGVAVVALGGYLLYNWSQRGKVEAEAQASMIYSLVYMEQDSALKAINGDGQNPGLLEVADEYGNTKAGNFARYMLGTAYLRAGNLEEGIAALEEYDQNRSMVSTASRGALAYAHEQKGEFEEAAKLYQEAAHLPADNMYSTPLYLMHAARNLESAGKAEEALALYEDIKTKYPNSDQVRDGSVDRHLAKLSPEDFE